MGRDRTGSTVGWGKQRLQVGRARKQALLTVRIAKANTLLVRDLRMRVKSTAPRRCMASDHGVVPNKYWKKLANPRIPQPRPPHGVGRARSWPVGQAQANTSAELCNSCRVVGNNSGTTSRQCNIVCRDPPSGRARIWLWETLDKLIARIIQHEYVGCGEQ